MSEVKFDPQPGIHWKLPIYNKNILVDRSINTKNRMVTFASILSCLQIGDLPAAIDVKFLEIATHILGSEVLPLIFVMRAGIILQKQTMESKGIA